MGNGIAPCSPEVAAKVVYEITMFRHGYEKLVELDVDVGNILPGQVWPRVGTGISSEEVRDASVVLESFLVHARVLHDFFCQSRRWEDDIVASDFVGTWAKPSESDYGYLNAQKERLDKALAHLTTTRVKYDTDGKVWDVATIRREIEGMIQRFFSELPDERRRLFEGV